MTKNIIIMVILAGTLLVSCLPKSKVKKKKPSLVIVNLTASIVVYGTSTSFGAQYINTSADKVFTVRNNGTGVAHNMSGASLNPPFRYKGGSYPGTGGSCGSSLINSRLCTIVVTYTPTNMANHSTAININYFNGSSFQTAQTNISGTGSSTPTSTLLISDGPIYDFENKYTNTSTDKIFTVSSNTNPISGISGSGLTAPFTFKGGSFPGIGGNCTTNLGAYNSCTIVVTYAPNIASPHNDTVLLNYYNGVSTQVAERYITGVGVALPIGNLSISDGPTYDFGPKYINSSTDKIFTISNVGTGTSYAMGGSGLVAPFIFKGGSYPGAGGNCGETLATSSNCLVVVSYMPTAIVPSNDTLFISFHNGLTSQTVQRNVAGSGLALPVANLSISDGATYNFGSKQINTSTDKVFTISNNGTGPASSMSGTGLSAPFIFKGGIYPGSGGNCNSRLAVSNSCTIVVTYTPTTIITHNGTIVFNYSDGQSNQAIQRNITGAGLAIPTANLSISNGVTYNFGSKQINTSTDKVFTISNSGTGTASSMGGTGLFAPFTYKGGNYPGSGGNCNSSLAASGTCTIVVTYAPTTITTHSDTILINYNNGVSNQTTQRNVTGTGLAIPVANLSISDGATYNFGSRQINSSTDKTFTISNSGMGPASSMGGTGLSAPYTFKGGNYPGSGGNCNANLAVSGTCTIVVTYTPTTITTHNDTILVNYNDGQSGQTVQRNVTGSGVAIPLANLSISDGATFDFLSHALNTSTDKTFTISNSGTGVASSVDGTGLLAPYTFKGGNYPGSGGNCNTSLVASGTCTIVITYTPTTITTHNDTVLINYNDGQSGQTVQRNVTGNGIAPTIVSRTIAWDQNPAQEILVGYKLYFGSASGTYDSACVTSGETSPIIVTIASLADPSNPSYTIDNFKADSACYFAISAYNDDVESAPSTDMTYTP